MTKDNLVGNTASDFRLIDTNGNTVKLSAYRSKKNVFLVFNRGFA